MTALGISLLVVGAIVIVIEAHVPTLGILGGPGLIALGVGAVLAISGLGAGIILGVLTALVLTAIGGGVLYASVRKGLAARRRPVRAGPERLIGHVGVVQSWASSGGKVLLDGALWRARHSWTLDDHQDEPLHPGDQVVVERLSGLTLGVRRAEDWELSAW
jgi:membrane-bound serine protease (ClpP class)